MKALLAQKSVATRVMEPLRLLLMRLAVQFHDQASRSAEKIDDVGCDRHLALELVAVEAPCPHPAPEQIFCARLNRALLPGERAQFGRHFVGSLFGHGPSPGSLRSPPSPAKGGGLAPARHAHPVSPRRP